MMKYAWPLSLVCGALLVAVVVLVVLNLQPEARDLPDLTLRDPRGQRCELASVKNRVWVASFVGSRCIEACPELFERLAELHDGLPPEVRLVTFVVEAKGLWPPSPPTARDRSGWVICQGNAVDADDESSVRELATAYLGFDAQQLGGLASGSPQALLVTVDARDRPRGRRSIDSAASAAAEQTVANVLGDVDFLFTLNTHPLRHAMLNGLSALLLIAGVFLIRRRLISAHLTCMVAATLTTVIFLVSYLFYHYHVGSMPFRGQGWSRPLYFAVLLTHTVLAAFVVPLAAAQFYHALRRQFARHKQIARWTVPIWLYVSITGVLIYFMLYIWFPGQ